VTIGLNTTSDTIRFNAVDTGGFINTTISPVYTRQLGGGVTAINVFIYNILSKA
jgi:hypothetical protein